jgi:hypothetical protein
LLESRWRRHGNRQHSADLVSNRGAITLTQDVDGNSAVTLTAAGDISIGSLSGNQDIHGDSFVSATSGGTISLGGQIDGSNTVVDFLACKSITIGQGISNGASVRLLTGAGGGSMTLGNSITDSSEATTRMADRACRSHRKGEPRSLGVLGCVARADWHPLMLVPESHLRALANAHAAIYTFLNSRLGSCSR